MSPWWTFNRFDVIWFATILTLWYWHTGPPHGLTEWALRLTASFAGWFAVSYIIHRWKTR